MQQTEEYGTIEPTLLRAVWRYRWLVLVITVLTTLVAWIYSNATAVEEFQAEASMQVEDPQASILFTSSPGTRRVEYVADQAEILQSGDVAQRAADIASKTDATFPYVTEDVLLQTNIEVTSDAGSVILISFVATQADWATLGANSLIEAYKELLSDETEASYASRVKVLDERISEIEKEVADLSSRIDTLSEPSSDAVLLEDRLGELRTELLTLSAERDRTSDPARLQQIRTDISDLDDEVTLFEKLLALESTDPDVAELQQRRSQLLQQIDDLTVQRNGIVVDSQLLGSGVVLTNPAVTAAPLDSGLRKLLIVGIFLGLLVGSSLAYLLALRNRTIENRGQPELILHAPLVASVPNFRLEGIKVPLPVRSVPRSASAEAFRFAAAALGLPRRRSSQGTLTAPSNTVMMVSASAGDGKTIVAVNTALAAAREGKRVLLIDADFGNQAATELLAPDVRPEKGMTEVVEVGASLTDAIIPIEGTESTGLHLLPRGWRQTTAPEFFRLPATREFLTRIQEYYDLVLVDAPPLLQVAYASTVAGMVDRLLVVVRHQGLAAELEELEDRLEFIGTPTIGYVYNLAPLRYDMTRTEGSMKDVLGTPERPEVEA